MCCKVTQTVVIYTEVALQTANGSAELVYCHLESE